jgi:aryl-alcohol dehydrogenase-like predicted oxidoreductase
LAHCPRDRRLTYEIYQGRQWEHSQDLLDILRQQSQRMGCTVSQLVVAWTLQKTGIDVALCGAKRPEQIIETSRAMQLKLSEQDCTSIDEWLNRPSPLT